MAQVSRAHEVVARLRHYYQRNPNLRRIDPLRRSLEGQQYKKGDEIRLVARTDAELNEIRRLLKRAGFKLARPWVKGRQWRQPVYGVGEVARFLSLVGAE